MKLYTFSWGMYPRRVSIYLKEKDITDIEIIELDVLAGETRSPAHLVRNPAGTVPVLEIGNNRFIRSSTGIIEYIEETYPDRNMIGNTAEKRGQTRDMVAAVHELYIYLSYYWAHCSPLMAQRFDQKIDAATANYQNYTRQLKNIETMINETEFLCGDTITTADCVMFGTAQFSDLLYNEPISDDTPKLQAWYNRFAKRKSALAPEYPKMIAEMAPPVKATT